MIAHKETTAIQMKNWEEIKSQVELDQTTAIMHLFTQLSLKRAIRKFVENGKNAGLEEMQQLHDKSVFNPVDWK